MIKEKINIVWLKRDLRTQDHLPFWLAEQSNLPYLVLFIIEPSLFSYPDSALWHWQFRYISIIEMNKTLLPLNKEVVICKAEALEVFESIKNQFEIHTIFSYQESGIELTYKRDKAITSWANEKSISWQECKQNGVIRGLKNRKDWIKHWFITMSEPCIENTFKTQNSITFINKFNLNDTEKSELTKYSSTLQPPGSEWAFKYLKSFLTGREKAYRKNISKPNESRKSCSRLSVYLSWGNLSSRQIYQACLQTKGFKNTAFISRLQWRCHFVQKFETDCTYEYACINKGYEHIYTENNAIFLNAWKEGKTGFPLIDASMACLKATGWINFRMRAMLVSFLCHHLFQDWRHGAHYLAQLFIDYEPGIHFTQFQMQAGTTGTNVIRVYNPVTNSLKHDVDAVFIKTWLPQLAHLPLPFIHQPWKLSSMEQQMYNFYLPTSYPLPIAKVVKDANSPKSILWDLRNNSTVKNENKRILKTHANPRKKIAE